MTTPEQPTEIDTMIVAGARNLTAPPANFGDTITITGRVSRIDRTITADGSSKQTLYVDDAQVTPLR